MLVPEEQLTHLTNMSGGPEDAVRRADMVYFETEGGGRVFSVGSITFCGSLPWNNFDNNVSRLLHNVLSHSLGRTSHGTPQPTGLQGAYSTDKSGWRHGPNAAS